MKTTTLEKRRARKRRQLGRDALMLVGRLWQRLHSGWSILMMPDGQLLMQPDLPPGSYRVDLSRMILPPGSYDIDIFFIPLPGGWTHLQIMFTPV